MLIVYGAGTYGRYIKNFLNKHNVHVNCFCETYLSNDYKIDNIPVVGLARLCNIMPKGACILLAIKKSAIRKQVRLLLRSMFFDDVDIVDAVEILGDKISNVGQHYCLLCNSSFSDFLPGGAKGDLFEKYHVIGAGYREKCICPVCGSFDRNRWFLYVLSKYTNIFTESSRVLHFAPEAKIPELLMANINCDYYSVDIKPGRAMHCADILDIPYKDALFDYVILNHVLEHVMDEATAIKEIKRILKPSGKMIISFPICTDKDTCEDDGISGPAERLKHYGQEDHVRLYGRDYKERIEKYGWQVEVYIPQDRCNTQDIDKYGFLFDDVIMICAIS